ncbi:MAG: flagellar protein FlaG, partial [Synergistaceae bacterium]|jgi:flagellar protein FlaG|nr:flagellar protein FlaG [Synergistaceae bacterium]
LSSFVSTSQHETLREALPLSVLSTTEAPNVELVKKVQEPAKDSEIKQDEKSVREMMKRTSELVSMMSHDLKFEVHDEAGIVQIHVIDATDGRIVRKIPSDEVLKLVTAIKEKMAERVDVKA